MKFSRNMSRSRRRKSYQKIRNTPIWLYETNDGICEDPEMQCAV